MHQQELKYIGASTTQGNYLPDKQVFEEKRSDTTREPNEGNSSGLPSPVSSMNSEDSSFEKFGRKTSERETLPWIRNECVADYCCYHDCSQSPHVDFSGTHEKYILPASDCSRMIFYGGLDDEEDRINISGE